METQVRTPQMIFMQPQRLIVPLFQRPYVWNEENQWEPLWQDVVRVADRLLQRPGEKHQSHFLGAVVLQQVQNPIGLMQTRTIIDGQQRLTTLQLLLDALHAVLTVIPAPAPAARIDPLVTNAEPFCSRPEDRYKVWPTNRDRAAFNAVMGMPPPVEHAKTGYRGSKMVDAHRFFTEQATTWLSSGEHDSVQAKAAAIETVVRDLIQLVVIDLTPDENAQEIFETLNARGAQLTAADLIKNFIFQRLLESGADVEVQYQEHWKDFETAFWESEISVGRLRYARSSVFLNHWLIAKTGEEVVAREVFDRFKRYADHDAAVPMAALLRQVHTASRVYRRFIDQASVQKGVIDRLGLFGYRTGVLESEIIKPLVLYLLDPELPPIPDEQLNKTLDVVESWMVRRMLVRATTKNYNQVVAEMVSKLRESERATVGDFVESFLRNQKSESRYWPDDEEVRQEVEDLVAYRRLRRARLRMLLEAMEDHLRGWRNDTEGLGGERVARGGYAIEHVMPRKWLAHWGLPDPPETDAERDRLIHTLGNLTLITGRLNSKVSNAAWLGEGGKRSGLEAHDVLLLNRELLKTAGDYWNDASIRNRTRVLAQLIVQIWRVPSGHKSTPVRERPRARRRVHLSDLINAGLLAQGAELIPRPKKLSGRTAIVLPDGQIEVDGKPYGSPSEAASAIKGSQTNGWWFFIVDPTSRRSLRTIRSEYITQMAVDADEDDDNGDDEDEENE